MKRMNTVLLAFLLVVTFSSCNNLLNIETTEINSNKAPDESSYDQSTLENSEDSTADQTVPSEPLLTFSPLRYESSVCEFFVKEVVLEKPVYRDLTFDSKTYHGTYQFTRVYYNGRTSDRYECENGTSFYFFSDESSFGVKSGFSDRLKYYTLDKFDEASIKGWLGSYIAEIFPTFNVNEYTYSCRTSARVSTDSSYTGMSYDYFYEPQSSNESVASYYFYYNRVIDGLQVVGDGITVITDGNGNIRAFYYHGVGNYNIDSINVSDIDFLRIDQMMFFINSDADVQYYFELTPDGIMLIAELSSEKDHFYVHIY